MDIKHLDHATVPISFSKIEPVKSANREFTLCKVYVQGCGKNRNYSYMSKENIEKALPTLSYVPVVGHLMPKFDADGNQTGYYFGSHDYEVTDDLQLKSLTVPFGVVVDDSFEFEEVEEYGKTVEYLTCLAYLWTGRYTELKDAIYSDDTWFNESMEVSNIAYRVLEEDSNYTEFLEWNYSALCILGKSDDPDYHSEPCFISSKIQPVQFDLADAQFNQLMGELKSELALCFDIEKTHQKEGKSLTQQERDAIFEKFSLSIDDVDFEVTEEMTEEDLTAKLEAFNTANHAENEPEDKPAEEQPAESGEFEHEEDSAKNEGTENETFSMTYREKEEALRNAVSALNFVQRDADGNCVEETYCYVRDFDDDYVFYSVDHYTKNEYKCKRVKQKYSFADGSASLDGDCQEVFQRWLTQAEIDKIDADEKQLQALTKFKEDTDNAEYARNLSKVLDGFADLSALEGFAAIKTDAEEHKYDTLESVENALFALRGRQVKVEKPVQEFGLKVGIDAEDKPEDDGYGGLIYRAKNKRK